MTHFVSNVDGLVGLTGICNFYESQFFLTPLRDGVKFVKVGRKDKN